MTRTPVKLTFEQYLEYDEKIFSPPGDESSFFPVACCLLSSQRAEDRRQGRKLKLQGRRI